MRFEYILIMTVCFLVICPITLILAAREAHKRKFGYSIIMLGIFFLTFFLSVIFLEMSIQTAPVSPAVIENLPYLKIRLSKPIKGAQYRIDGPVASIREHEIKILEEMDYEKSTVVMFHKESDYDSITGNCLVMKNAFRKIAVTMWKEKENSDFTAIHEEMHVVQAFKINEAYKDIHKRFLLLGYKIHFDRFSYEEQADLAGILIYLERGFSLDDIASSVTHDSDETIRKIKSSSIPSLEKNK